MSFFLNWEPTDWTQGFEPVSRGKWHATLLPDDVRSGVSSDLAFEEDASSLHQLLNGGFLDEEGSSGLSCSHLCHHLFLCLHGNTEQKPHLHQTLQMWKHTCLNRGHSRWSGRYKCDSRFLLCDSNFSDSRLLSALNVF